MLAIILLIVMGLASVIGSEVLSMVALSKSPIGFDLTDNFFMTLVLANFNNPPADIATDAAIVPIAAAVIPGSFYALFWRTRT